MKSINEPRKEPNRSGPPRKPYRTPQLQVLGSMRALTRSMANGAPDGMNGSGMTNTHA